MIPPTNRPGSSVVERPACHGEIPGPIPGLAHLVSSYSDGLTAVVSGKWVGCFGLLPVCRLQVYEVYIVYIAGSESKYKVPRH